MASVVCELLGCGNSLYLIDIIDASQTVFCQILSTPLERSNLQSSPLDKISGKYSLVRKMRTELAESPRWPLFSINLILTLFFFLFLFLFFPFLPILLELRESTTGHLQVRFRVFSPTRQPDSSFSNWSGRIQSNALGYDRPTVGWSLVDWSGIWLTGFLIAKNKDQFGKVKRPHSPATS